MLTIQKGFTQPPLKNQSLFSFNLSFCSSNHLMQKFVLIVSVRLITFPSYHRHKQGFSAFLRSLNNKKKTKVDAVRQIYLNYRTTKSSLENIFTKLKNPRCFSLVIIESADETNKMYFDKFF